MKYIEEFRNDQLAAHVASEIAIHAKPDRQYRFMEFCGGHTHTIHRYGLPTLLPDNVNMIHGPGCPVCVLPISKIDQAIALASLSNVILCTYADMLRIPGSGQNSLLKAKARGGDVRMVYSIDDALSIAIANPRQEVVFFAIGFETTTPPTAVAIQKALQLDLKNFSVFCNHILTPIAMDSLLKTDEVQLDGFVGPAHVSIVIGSQPYERICHDYHKPIVISGFEPLDVLYSILMLINQINQGRCEVENQYIRAVNREGNSRSIQVMADVFNIRETFEWRGLGYIPKSGLEIKPEYAVFDAEKRFDLPHIPADEHRQCLCGSILRGIKQPKECSLFSKACTPEQPLGACMVSSEGACAAVYAYGR